MSEPRDLSLRANGLKHHAIEWPGDDGAHLVMMLHGCGSNCWFWYPLAVRLHQRFGRDIRIVATDHRGCGDSESPADGYTPDVVAADVLAIHEQLTDEPMTLIGHSRGGWMGGYVGGHFPDRLAGLVLVDPARMVWPSIDAANEFYDRVGRGLGPFGTFEDAVENMRQAHPTALVTEDRLRAVRFGLREEGGKLVGKMPRYVLDQLKAARIDADEVGPYLENVTAPTLVLISSQSNATRQAEKRAYADGIAQAEVEYFDTSHYLHQDKPDDVAERVGRFMSTYLVEESPK